MRTAKKNKLVWIVTLFISGFFAMSATAATGDDEKPGVEDPTPASKLMVGKLISSRNDHKKYVFKGIITDLQTNLPLKGAKITMKGTSVGAVTDAYGLYLFNIPENLVKENMFFEINYPGYERKSFFIDKDLLPILDEGVNGQIKRLLLK